MTTTARDKLIKRLLELKAEETDIIAQLVAEHENTCDQRFITSDGTAQSSYVNGSFPMVTDMDAVKAFYAKHGLEVPKKQGAMRKAHVRVTYTKRSNCQ